jgi:hypothetical protein
MEVETQIQIARDLGYLEKSASENLLNDAAEGRILNGLLASLPSRKGVVLTTGHWPLPSYYFPRSKVVTRS